MKNKTLGSKVSYGICVVIVAVVFASSFYVKIPHIFGEEQQKSMTPDQVLQDLMNGNKRFYSNTLLRRQSLVVKSQKAGEWGQFPKAVILACMDSRSIPEIVFDQTIADIFTLRVAGNVVNDDMLASLEYATKHSGAKVIVIMGHTQCGAIKAACAREMVGNLKYLDHTIELAIATVQKQSSNKRLDCSDSTVINEIAMQNVRNMMRRVMKGSPVIKELISQGSVKMVGALHDLETGVVTFEEMVGVE